MYRRWDGSAGAWVLDEAVETLERQQLELPPLSSRPDDLNAWAAANTPPCRDDFATQELFDAARGSRGTVCAADGHEAAAVRPEREAREGMG